MRARNLLLSACFVLAAPAVAHAGPLDGFMVAIFDTRTGFGLETSGTVYMNTLNDGYMDLSKSRSRAVDWHDGEHFNHKARTAALRSTVPPDEVSDRDLSDPDRQALTTAFFRLRRSFIKGGKEVAPADAAYGQVAYDCWIEAAEGGREDDATRCRTEFENRMARVEELADFGYTPLPISQPPDERPYMVYFQFDSIVTTQAGREKLARAIASALAEPDTTVLLTAHADRAGPENYNQSLSERRATVVIQEMTWAGVDRNRIQYEAVGESRPLVPTADGIRNPFNRVVQIDLM